MLTDGQPPDLSWVTTEALVDEFKRRHDTVIICTQHKLDDNREVVNVLYRGFKNSMVGLLVEARKRIGRLDPEIGE